MNRWAQLFIVVLVMALIVYAIHEVMETMAGDRVRTDVFQAPEPGDHVRIELLSGISRAGVIREARDDAVIIRTSEGEVTYPRQVIAPTSRRLLFRSDYDGTPPLKRPATVIMDDLPRILAADDFTPDDLGFSSNVQYVIAGTNTIIIYRGRE